MAEVTNIKTISFHYIKSPLSREIPVSGAVGGINLTSGDVTMSLYSERPAIPQLLVYELKEDATLGDEVQDLREGKEGYVRIVEDTLHMNLATAISVHTWLTERLDAFKEANPKVFSEDGTA